MSDSLAPVFPSPTRSKWSYQVALQLTNYPTTSFGGSLLVRQSVLCSHTPSPISRANQIRSVAAYIQRVSRSKGQLMLAAEASLFGMISQRYRARLSTGGTVTSQPTLTTVGKRILTCLFRTELNPIVSRCPGLVSSLSEVEMIPSAKKESNSTPTLSTLCSLEELPLSWYVVLDCSDHSTDIYAIFRLFTTGIFLRHFMIDISAG